LKMSASKGVCIVMVPNCVFNSVGAPDKILKINDLFSTYLKSDQKEERRYGILRSVRVWE